MNIRIPEQNHVLLVGRLTRDPNLTYTAKGVAVALFDIAVNRNYKDATGEWREDTAFVPIVAWNQTAERVKEKLKKGTPVHVEGRLTSSEYTDKDGNKRKTLKVAARRIQSLAAQPRQAESEESASEPVKAKDSGSDDSIDEVPF